MGNFVLQGESNIVGKIIIWRSFSALVVHAWQESRVTTALLNTAVAWTGHASWARGAQGHGGLGVCESREPWAAGTTWTARWGAHPSS